jgi:hypothetical protein
MAQNIRQVNEEPSIGTLVANLSRETATLVRQELNLARAELTSKAGHMGKDIGMVVAGGAMAYAGLLALVATAIIALAYALPWWLAALIVAVVVTAFGGALALQGIAALKRENPAPQQTITTLKENVQWAKDQAS